MAEVTIRLIYNLETGKKDILVDYESDADALPIEHEEGHRQILAELLGKGVISQEEAGEVVIRRVQPGSAEAPTKQEDSTPPESQAQQS